MKELDSREQTIVIRQAEAGENEKIWDILHANCRTWTVQQILDNIGGMYVLTMGQKMLGVLFCSLSSCEQRVDWVEINPLYPEKILKDVFIKGVLGILKPDIEAKILQKGIDRQLSPIWSYQSS